MKNQIKILGPITFACLLLEGCGLEDKVMQERTFSGGGFLQAVGELSYYSSAHKKTFYVHGISTWRDYPCQGPIKPLPRAEVKEYTSGKITVDLYFPKR